MIKTNELMGEAAKNGLTLGQLSKEIGIDYSSLYRKMNGESDFKVSEVMKIKKVLKLSSRATASIFFAD